MGAMSPDRYDEPPADRPPRRPGRGTGARDGTRAARAAQRARRAAGATAHGSAAAARGTANAARSTARRVRRATNAEGAGESGLGRLIELHAVNMAGDTLVTIALAGTLFFAVPVGEARGRVALYLLVTMAPFAVVAPVVGPLLDRFRHGRRYALAASLAGRALLAWVMGTAVVGGQDAARLYPAAFGLLVLSKAYGVTRAAMVPRVLPAAVTLVRANSRITLGGLVTTALAAPLGAALAFFGTAWPLRLATAVYLAGAVLALSLPRRADSAAGERISRMSAARARTTRLRNVGPVVVTGLRANASLRAFSGFLTLYLAFLLRTHPLQPLAVNAVIGLAAAAAAIGGFAGTGLGSVLRARPPETLVVVVLSIASVCAALGAWFYALWAVLLVALAAGLAQSLGKLALDALIQREVPERWRTSAFARSETALQLAWVLGGGIGILTPLRGALGLGAAALVLVLMLALTVQGTLRLRDRDQTSRSSATARNT